MKSASLPDSLRPLATGIRSRVRRSSFVGSFQVAGGTRMPLRQIKEAPDVSEECVEDEEDAPDSRLREAERDICAMIAARYEAAASLAMQHSQTDFLTDPDKVPSLWMMLSPGSSLTLEDDDGESHEGSIEPVSRCAEQESSASSSSEILRPRRDSSSKRVTEDESARAQSPKNDSDSIQERRPTSPAADACATEKSAELRSASGSPQKSRQMIATRERCAPPAARSRSRERATSLPSQSSELPRSPASKEPTTPPREQDEKLVSTTIQEQPLYPATANNAQRLCCQNLQQTRNPEQRPSNTGKKQVVSPPGRMQRTQPSSLMRPGRHSVPGSSAAIERYQERSASPPRRTCEELGLAASTGQLPCEPVSVAEQGQTSSPATSKHARNMSNGSPQQITSPKRPRPSTPTVGKEQVSSPPEATQRTPPRSAGRSRKLSEVGSSAAKQVAAAATSATASQRQQQPPTQLHTGSTATRAPSPPKKRGSTVPMVVAKLEELASESQLLHWPSQLLQWPFQALPSSVPYDGSSLGAPFPPSTWTSLDAGAPTSPGQTPASSVICPASTADTAATAAIEMSIRAVDDGVDAKITSTECPALSSTAQSTRVGSTRSRSLPKNNGVQRALLTPPPPGLARSASMCAPAASSSAQGRACPKTGMFPSNTQSMVHLSGGREGAAQMQTQQQRTPLRASEQQQAHRHQQEPVTRISQEGQPVQFQVQPWPQVQAARCHLPQALYTTAQPTRSVRMQPPPPARSTARGRESSNQSVEEGSRPSTPRLWESNAKQKLCTARSMSPGYGLTARGAFSSSPPPRTPPSGAPQGATNRNWFNLQDFASPLTPPSPVHLAPCGYQRTDMEHNSSVAAAAWAAAGQIIREKQLRSDSGRVPRQCIASSSPRSASSPKLSTSRVHSPGDNLGGYVSDLLPCSACSLRVPSPDARMVGVVSNQLSCSASPLASQSPRARISGCVPDRLPGTTQFSQVSSPDDRHGGLVPDDLSRSVRTPKVLSPEARMGDFLADSSSFPASPPGVQPPKHTRMGGFVPDQLDRMDKAVEELLRHLDETTVERLAVRKVAPCQYLIDGRHVSLQWGRGGSISRVPVSTNDLLVFEQEAPCFIGDGIDLPIYISQAANVSASLCGADPGASAVGRIPQEFRLTFRGGDNFDSEGMDSVSPNIRKELMKKAVQEASLRQNAAEQTERKLSSPRDCRGKRRHSRTALPSSTQALLSL